MIEEIKKDITLLNVIDKLKLKGLNDIYIIENNSIDYLDTTLAILDFLVINKEVYKNLEEYKYEHLILLCLNYIIEKENLKLDNFQLNKILKLLKNNYLTNSPNTIWKLIYKYYYYYYYYYYNMKYYVEILLNKFKKD